MNYPTCMKTIKRRNRIRCETTNGISELQISKQSGICLINYRIIQNCLSSLSAKLYNAWTVNDEKKIL